MGNNIIHVSGITSTLFPSDGGQIRVERTEYVQGMCIHLNRIVTGYDVGNNIIHVSGITSTLFPSDGGQIRVERTEYVQGMCIPLDIVVHS